MALIENLIDILDNIRKTIPNVNLILGGIVYTMGVWFIIKSLLVLKKSAESGKPIEVKGPLVLMLVGVVLLYSPTFIKMAMTTIYGRPDLILSYKLDTTIEYAQDLLDISGQIIRVIGFIAFVRGWVILARYGEEGGKGGHIGKALMHILGGLLAINIFGTFKIIQGILGI